MSLGVRLQADPEAMQLYFSQTATAISDAQDASVVAATRETKRLGRAEVQSGLSTRAGNTLSTKYFLGSRDDSKGLVGFFYSRWWTRSVAGDLVDVLSEFETGATITPKDGDFLAIPLESIGKFAGATGSKGARMTPASFKRRYGVELRTVVLHGHRFLVTDQARLSRAKGVPRGFKGNRTRLKSGGYKTGVATLFLFELVRQTRLPKKIDLGDLDERMASSLLLNFLNEFDRRSAS